VFAFQCPEASASPLRSIPADGSILKQPLLIQSLTQRSDSLKFISDLNSLNHYLSQGVQGPLGVHSVPPSPDTGIWDNEDVYDLRSVETEFPAIVFNDTLTSEIALSCEPTVSSLNNDKIDFRISFDESDDEDCTVIFNKNSFSYKIIHVNDIKTDLENDNDKVNMPLLPSPEPTVSYFDDLDFFNDFENEFLAIVYNDALTSKSDFLTEPTISIQHIDEFNLKDETSLSGCDEEEQNVLYFNDVFPFNVIYPDDSKSDKDNDDDKIDIKQSSGGPREGKSTNVGGEFTNLEILKCWSLENSRRIHSAGERIDMSGVDGCDYSDAVVCSVLIIRGVHSLDQIYGDARSLKTTSAESRSWVSRPHALRTISTFPVVSIARHVNHIRLKWITIEEYIRLEEEKARRRAIVFNDTLTSETTLSCEPTVSSLNNDEIDFRISFDESDDEDCTVIFNKKSFSYKIISVNDIKTDLENDNDKVNMSLLPSPDPTVSYFNDLDFFKDFENEFLAIVYNDALTSKSDFLTEPTISIQHIDEFNLKDETSLSGCDEEEQNVLYFNDVFPFNVIYPDNSKSDKDNDDDKIDIKQSSGSNVINTDSLFSMPLLYNIFVNEYPSLFGTPGINYGLSLRNKMVMDVSSVLNIVFVFYLGPREGKSTNVGGEFTNLEILKC
ncbi:hypothetical protein Tco_0030807, partial [Tanacetum coccineum]